MPLVETESLILRTYNLAEADKVVVLFTEEHGIVRGVAKGAKRLKSRFGSGLEPFSVVRITYFQKEVLELVSIQKIDLIESYFEAASDPEFLQKFSYLTDILVGSVPPHDPSETLYRMVKACLETAAADHQALDSIGLYFEVWLLKLTGYLPQWTRCSECSRAFAPDEPAGLRTSNDLACADCRKLSAMVQVSPQHRSALANALRLSPADFARSGVTAQSIHEVSEILKREISQALGRHVTESRPLAAGTDAR